MHNKHSMMKWIVFVVVAVFYFYEYILRISPNTMVPELMMSFQADAAQIGILSAFFFYAYAPMQIPVGLLIDYYGERNLLTIAATLSAIGVLAFAATTNIWAASMGRLLIGASAAFAFVGMVYVCSHWFPPSKRAMMIGLANSIGMIGAYTGGGPLSYSITHIGWRHSLQILGLFGIVLSFVLFASIRKRTEHLATKMDFKTFFLQLKDLIKVKAIWVNAVVALLFYVSTTILGGLWGVPYLQSAYGLSKEAAAFTVSMIFIGWLVGGPTMGWLSDASKKRQPIITGGILFTFIAVSYLLYGPKIDLWGLHLIMFLIGFFSSAELLNFTYAIEAAPKFAQASVTAFTNFMIAAFGSFAQPFVGWMLDRFWNGKMIGSIPYYSPENFMVALSLLPCALALAFFLSLFMKEERIALEEEGPRN